MSITFEQLLVALVVLVPGFIVTSMHRAFGTKAFPSQFEWFVSSILQSIFLNAFCFSAMLLVFGKPFSTFNDALQKLPNQPLSHLAWYVSAVYLFAIFWGAATGKWQQASLRAVANRLGITPYAPHSSVWDRLFAKQVPKGASAIWICTKLSDQTEMLGRLRHSSEVVEQDKPIELYVSPYFFLRDNKWIAATLDGHEAEVSNGMYLKLIDSAHVKFFFRPGNWAPNLALQGTRDEAARP